MSEVIAPFTGKALKNWKFGNKKESMTLLLCLKEYLGMDMAFEVCIRFIKSEKFKARDEQYEVMGRGTSKSAHKRRMKKFELCRGCGKFLHDGLCKQSTRSQHEVRELLKCDPIKIKSERVARYNSNALMMVERLVDEINRKKEKRKKDG